MDQSTLLVLAGSLASATWWYVRRRPQLALASLSATPRRPLALPAGLYASSRAPSGAAGGAADAHAAAIAPADVDPVLDPVSRRQLLRWVGWTSLLVILGELLVGFLPFFWPRKTGAFGGTVNAGNVSDFKVGEVRKITEGKFYLSRVPEGFLALWQKCPHLGCTVPWAANDRSEDSIEPTGRFNCPCHGSIYDRYGQIITGPAPRPMDMFPIEIRDGRIFVSTGPDKAKLRSAVNHQTDPVPA